MNEHSYKEILTLKITCSGFSSNECDTISSSVLWVYIFRFNVAYMFRCKHIYMRIYVYRYSIYVRASVSIWVCVSIGSMCMYINIKKIVKQVRKINFSR